MPDREKIISEIAERIEATIAVDSEYVNIPLDLFQYALALLKEQEPVKPVQHLVYTTKGWFCGACDGRLNRLGKYCSFCGKPVKWE